MTAIDPAAADAALVADLARVGLVVTAINRANPARLIVVARDAHGLPYAAIVAQGPGDRDHAFARLLTKALLG